MTLLCSNSESWSWPASWPLEVAEDDPPPLKKKKKLQLVVIAKNGPNAAKSMTMKIMKIIPPISQSMVTAEDEPFAPQPLVI